ncbi:hypothetical protein N7532_001779 [Penicillium argentinense]|uniref:Uncharacterized protein n=1 Tax=Penicillium argentinense TaxID=1131581 RepID=A0A9W9G364_9EURO|nr:uncharacterized protein N7532_001779 [Penicillium argentinense]KAJ5111244.1 hypothetical protein N7532_001779 [Penicillium argentinense]
MGVGAWSGYVSLPKEFLNNMENMSVDYDINLFFWYFEARHNPSSAPTSIYLGGGPGRTSLDSMSGFPCNINPDSNSMKLNPLSWNKHVYGNDTEHDRTGLADPVKFAQVWFQEFPDYRTTNKKVSLWGTSPPTWLTWHRQWLHRYKAQAASFPHIEYNNTYGIQLYNHTMYSVLMQNVTAPKTGCYDLVDQYRVAAAEGDSTGQGTNETVNAACQTASAVYFVQVLEAYMVCSQFDLARLRIDSDEPNYFNGFFNQRWPHISHDTKTNECKFTGMGVENISLAAGFHSAPSLRAAGYEDVRTNKTYKGGVVRQHGISRFRVFQGGHAVAAYEPETIYRIFQRSMFGLDVATGHIKTDSHYSSKGPRSNWHIKNQIPVENRETVSYTNQLA